MKRIKLPKDVWLSLYKSLHDTIGHATRIKALNNDDVRDEVLNIMNFYFDKNFEVGITKDTVIKEHE
jgi:hypothetical protein